MDKIRTIGNIALGVGVANLILIAFLFSNWGVIYFNSFDALDWLAKLLLSIVFALIVVELILVVIMEIIHVDINKVGNVAKT